MYGDVVMGVQKRPEEDHEPFETVIHELKHERYHTDIDDTQAERERFEGAGRAFQKFGERTHRQSNFRTIRGRSCRDRSAPCSVRG